MSQFPPLHSSKEKIKRAKAKFGHLLTTVNGYVNSNPHEVIVKENSKRAYIISRLVKDLPEGFAWEIVEAVGHLRSALDKLMIDLVKQNSRGLSGVGYPFGNLGENGKPDTFPSGRHDHIKKKLTTDQWELVLTTKPYPRGNDTLWSINEIANADKHREGLVGRRRQHFFP